MRLRGFNIALYMGLIFSSGLLVGAFGHRLYTATTVAAKTTRNADEWRKRYISEMQTRLNLRPNQVTELNAILDETRTRFQEVHEKYRPEMDSIKQQQIGKIQSILDGNQKGEYEKMRVERERKVQKPGAPPPGF